MNKQFFKLIALVLLISLAAEIFAPITVWALTGGPSQPEFSKFEPVSTTSMVNEFDGSFTYNLPVLHIPGPDGGEYAMSLSYHSGTSPEEEASWVGYGWTLNPGSITRNKRGFPDDQKGAKTIYWNKTRKNWSISAGVTNQTEFFGNTLTGPLLANLEGGVYARYNNNKGFGYTATAGVNVEYVNASAEQKGIGNLNLSIDDERGAIFSGKITAAAFLSKLAVGEKKNANGAENEKTGVIFSKDQMAEGTNMAANILSAYAFRSFTDHIRPMALTPYEGKSYNFSYNGEDTRESGSLPFGPEYGIHGNYNYQKNVEKQELRTYGYMYSGDGGKDEDGVMDYQVEKNSPYSRRDYYLSIPYSSADNFIVTGEGIAGGFRLFQNTAGYFKPNKVSSNTEILQGGVEPHTGTDIGIGLSIGVGNQQMTVGKWVDPDSQFRFKENKTDIPHEQQFFFRYNNDMGGSIFYSANDNAERSEIVHDGTGFKPKTSNSHFHSHINNAQKTGRSSFIGYRTIREMREKSTDVYYRSFSREENTGVLKSSRRYFLQGNEDDDVYESSIGEVSTVNDQGQRYTYGLPVYSRNEYNISYGVDPNVIDISKHIIYKNIQPPGDDDNSLDSYEHSVIGEKRSSPYAVNYLLTEITTPDFVDRTNNGLTSDDFGGYVKFQYKRAATPAMTSDAVTSNKTSSEAPGWYRWRVPYNGFFYHQNEISDLDDDMMSMSKGEKEVYYLQAVETKTHIAVFVTNKTSLTINGKTIAGSQKERLDGYEAAEELSASANQYATTAGGHDGQPTPNKLEYLERIELYAKDELGNPNILLKTVRFEYDYSLMKGVPNAGYTTTKDLYPERYCGDGALDYIDVVPAGKLTLKRVWFEYEGVSSAQIAPYVFNYEYKKPSEFPAEILETYGAIVNYGGNYAGSLPSADQNPDYNLYNIDPWGNYRKNGEDRFIKRREWVNQRDNLPGLTFDPAAWQLKSIQLPSGGEILVQYEQHTYSYVQDQAAMAMVSIADISEDGKHYYLNLQELGITTNSEKQRMADMIQKSFVDGDEKMYFKFLYALLGSEAHITDPQSEYIDGYVSLKGTGVDPNREQVYVTLGPKDDNDDDVPVLPRHVCKDFVQKNRGGLEPGINPFKHAGDGDNFLSDSYNILSKLVTFTVPTTLYCANLNQDYSFLRVPLPVPKKGGGIRVKRLLMYDKGLETGGATLYGTEYLYEYKDQSGIKASYGVASNEPASIREENALVRYLHKREDQNFFQKIISGKDKEQFEGPIGEALLPGASVGYSRVISRNIHQGATSPGFSINDYYTWKDFPIKMEHTSISEEPDFYIIPAGVVNMTFDNIWATQGYSFTLNNMAGILTRGSTYAGVYEDPNSWLLSTLQENEYFKPGEKIPMHYGMTKPLQYENPGKEMEVIFEGRSVEDETIDGHAEIDISVPAGNWFPPFVTLAPSLSYNSSKMRTHVTTKVISYPAIVKSSKVIKDGVTHFSENVAFDPNTGRPLITKTTDGFDGLKLLDELNIGNTNKHNGSYYSYQIPAAHHYDAMGQKAWNEQQFVKSNNDCIKFLKKEVVGGGDYYILVNSTGTENPTCGCDIHKRFSKGDLIELWDHSSSAGIFHIESIVGNRIDLEKTSYSSTHTASTDQIIDIEILASGHTNQLVAGAGSLVSYGNNPSSGSGSNNIPTFLEFPTILQHRQQLVDGLNAILRRNEWDRQGYVDVPAGMQYLNGSTYQAVPANSVVELTTQNNQYTLKVGSRILESYSANYSQTHDLVDLFNDALHTYWGTVINNLTPYQSMMGTGLGFADWRYRKDDLSSIQTNLDDLVDSRADYVTGRFNWVNGGFSEPITISMVPTTGGYQGPYVTAIAIDNPPLLPQKRLASLQLNHGTTPIMSAYMQAVDATTYQWNIVPPGNKVVGSTAPLPFDLQSGWEVGRFVQDGDKIKFECYKPLPMQSYELPGIALNKWVFIPDVCTMTLPRTQNCNSAYFALNEQGEIVYYEGDAQCCTTMLTCPQFVPNEAQKATQFGNIIAASAQTYGDTWNYDESLYNPINTSANNFEKAVSGKWRPTSSYAYRTDVDDEATSAALPIYQRGIYKDFTAFNWKNPSSNNTSKWIRASTVTAYSPNGQILAEKDVLDMPSAAKFGYHDAVPYLVAKNAEPSTVQFESFENLYSRNSGYYLENGVVMGSGSGNYKDNICTTYAHSGKKSYLLDAAHETFQSADFVTPRQIGLQYTPAGLSVKVWVKHPASQEFVPIAGKLEFTDGSFSSIDLPFTKVARTGAWALYEASLQPDVFTIPMLSKQARVVLRKDRSINDIYIDDVRIQPLDAEMTCYVYDTSTLRLTAIFDDQHFGLYYQYNAEGKLVRKLAETEKGIKTIVETQYNIPLANYYFTCPPPSGGGDTGGGGDNGGGQNGSSLIDPGNVSRRNGVEAGKSLDLLDIRLTPDSQKVKMLDGQDVKLPESSTTLPLIQLPAQDSTNSRQFGTDKIAVPKVPVAPLRQLKDTVQSVTPLPQVKKQQQPK